MNDEPRAPVRIRIDTVAVTAASAVEARRLADALPAALDRAWRGAVPSTDDPPSPRVHRRIRAADAVADEVVRAVRSALDRRGPGGGAP